MRCITLLGMLVYTNVLLATVLPNQKINVAGSVVALDSGDPLEYATVSAYTLDTTLIDGTVTDPTGVFQFRLAEGQYLLKFEYLGFISQFKAINLTSNIQLDPIQLEADQVNLDAVEVRAEKSQMNLLLDKKVFNVGQDALSRGGSANEVLEQLPSVTVNAEGVVSLRGNDGVRILINGRPSALANNNALTSIPAHSIEKVEIITNPSARYEAAGTAGIINIILKKEVNQGYGGTVSLSVGYPADHRPGINLNWRKKKYNAFANLGARYANFRGGSDIIQQSFLEGVIDNLREDYRMKRQDRAFSAYTGIDYLMNDKNTLTATYSIYDMVNDDLYTTDYFYTDGEGVPVQNWDQELDYLEPGRYQQLDFIFSRSYDEEGRKLAVYFRNDFWNEEETELVQIDEIFPANKDLLDLRTNTIESSRDHLLQADYETPTGENGKLEIGIRGETRIISADYIAETLSDNTTEVIPGFDNKLDYFERIGAAYAQYRFKKDAFGFQVGLRNEYTLVRVESNIDLEEDIRKSYNRLFPSFSLSYQLSDPNSTQLSYSRRIRRPSFWQLNPFRGFNDPSVLFIGNPDMDPAYTDRVELNFMHRSEKWTVNPAIYASRTTDYFEVARDQIADNLFGFATGMIVNQPINLDREDQYGIELITTFRPSDAVSLSGEVNYYGYQQRGTFEERSFDFDFATWTGALRLQVELPRDMSIQSRFSYNARRKTVQMLFRGNYFANASFSKKWNDKLTFTWNVQSPRWWEVEVFRPSFELSESGNWTGWRTGISMQYRFEKGAKADSRRGRGNIR